MALARMYTTGSRKPPESNGRASKARSPYGRAANRPLSRGKGRARGWGSVGWRCEQDGSLQKEHYQVLTWAIEA